MAIKAPAEAQSARVLITNVNIVTLDNRGLIPNASILVSGGRIERLLRQGQPLPRSARVIDGNGGYLLPGFIDSHTHYRSESDLLNYIRHGVTTTLSLGNSAATADQIQTAQLQIQEGTLIGPQIHATGPIIANHVILQSAQEVEAYLDSLQRRGFGFVKVYNDTPQAVLDAVFLGARQRGMGVFGHMPRTVSVEYALSNGLNVVAHMEEFFSTAFDGPNDASLESFDPAWTPDFSRIDRTLDLLVTNNVAVIPNLVTSFTFQQLWFDADRVLSSPEFSQVDPETLESWRRRNFATRDRIERRVLREQVKYPLMRTMTLRAQQRGVLLLAGTDAPMPGILPGHALHQELRLLVAAGLTNEEALRTATTNAGVAVRRFVDRDACIGVIEAGCEADFVLLRSNPIDDIRQTQHIVGVMSDGLWRTRLELDALARR